MSTPTITGSKPEAIAALRATWRKSAEHKAAQVWRFLSALGAILTLQVVSDITAHKNPLEHFTDTRTAWYYLVPLIYVAWRQVRPAMTAGRLDSAPGATIVPEQVGLPAAPDPAPVVTPDQAGIDTTPTGDAAADGTPAPPDVDAPAPTDEEILGDAAP